MRGALDALDDLARGQLREPGAHQRGQAPATKALEKLVPLIGAAGPFCRGMPLTRPVPPGVLSSEIRLVPGAATPTHGPSSENAEGAPSDRPATDSTYGAEPGRAGDGLHRVPAGSAVLCLAGARALHVAGRGDHHDIVVVGVFHRGAQRPVAGRRRRRGRRPRKC